MFIPNPFPSLPDVDALAMHWNTVNSLFRKEICAVQINIKKKLMNRLACPFFFLNISKANDSEFQYSM